MPHTIPLHLDDEDRLFEPPLVDVLYYDESANEYVITFIPSDDASGEATEVVRVGVSAPDFSRVESLYRRIQDSVGAGRRLVRIVHGGGGNFTFHIDTGAVTELAVQPNAIAVDVADRLKQI